MDMKAKERIMYDNYNLETMYEDAKENIFENTGEDNPTDDQIWDEIYQMDEWNRDDFRTEMEKILDGSVFLAIGTCGRWNGTFPGGFLFETFNELFDRFSDCQYFKIWDENGHLFLKGSHHDGTDEVEIKRVTERGENYFANWEYNWGDKRTEREVHWKMFNDSHYTNLINFAHKIWGCPRRENA